MAMGSDGSDLAGAVRTRIEHCFRQIETERMVDIPILNGALRVEVVGLRPVADEWLCILVTPWFMNIMLLPTSNDDRVDPKTVSPGAIGSRTLVAFPAGRFEMIRGFEAGIGHYRMCSLFSPMHEFADHESAVLAAKAALDALIEADADIDSDMAMIWRGERPARRPSEQGREADTGLIQSESIGQTDDGKPVISLSRRGLLLGRARAEEAK